MTSSTERLSHLQGLVSSGKITPDEVQKWSSDEANEHNFPPVVGMKMVADHIIKHGVDYYRRLPAFEDSLRAVQK